MSLFGIHLDWPSGFQLDLLFIAGVTAFAYFILARRDVVSRLALNNSGVSILFGIASLITAPILLFWGQHFSAVYALLGVPSVPTAFWSGVPLWATVLCSLVAYDFANYWSHRLLHLPMFWRIHAIHHSDSHVNAFTSYRIHVLEIGVMLSVDILFLSWLGLPAAAAAAAAVFVRLHNFYVHMELDIDHGPLRYLIASPRFHRWHHADVPEIYGKNLANIIPLFDVMFGTYHVPGRCTAPLGAKAAGVPDVDFIRLFLFPFTGWRMGALPVLGWRPWSAELVRRVRRPDSPRETSPRPARARYHPAEP